MTSGPLLVGIAALGALAFGGCVSLDSSAPPVTPALVQAARGVPASTLEEGRRIYAGACTACHSADPVSRYSATRWREIVVDMADRAKLDPAREQALLAYIQAAKALPRPL